MATIKLKRGSGVPTSNPGNPVQDVPLAAGEPAMDTATGRVYIAKTGDGSAGDIVEVGSTALDSNVSNNLTVGNDATVSNNLSVGLDLTVTDDATVGDNLTVGGNVSATGNVTGSNLNVTDWNTAYSRSPTNLIFNPLDGVLTLRKGDLSQLNENLDGRFLQAAGGLFVPVFSDESGNTASYNTQYGAYSKIFIGTDPLDFQQKWFMISVSGINTSGLVSTDKLVIDLTSVLAIDAPVSAENVIVTEQAGFIHALNRGALIHGYPENNNQFNTKIVLRATDRDSQAFITIGDITSVSNKLVMSGWIL